jgi:general secretion pathway protein E
MQVLDFAQSFAPDLSCLSLAEVGSAISAVSLGPPNALFRVLGALPFNPIKLVCLVAWVYLCLYFVQRVQVSPLVPDKYKAAANIVTLFVGPLLLLTLLIVDTVKKSAERDGGIFEIVKQQVRKVLANPPMVASAGPVRKADSTISLLNSSGSELKEIYGHGDSKGQDKHILFLTEQIIADALEQRASDILIDPKDDSTYTVRLRIDGLLRTVKQLKAGTCKAIVNSIKAVASMDISEKRRPQDGAFIAKRGEETASFRVASAGVLHGEKLSIRVLNKDAGIFTLTDVGFTKKQHALVENAINKPSGMILICGPTGSGKTTTMYAMLNQIDRLTRNVITVEDPIEAVLPEASQIEVNPKADITFAKALRSILRQDPDVICVGEIRDEETAEIALRASQTGHLVLATIHCDSNATALVRLLDLGVSPLLLSSGLSLLASQRLLRQLCNRCKRRARLNQSLIEELQKKGLSHRHIFDAVGCKYCSKTGYFGRTAICDLLVITDEIKANIANEKALVTELRTEGNKKDRANLRWEGLKKAASGITSLEEIKRVVG